MHDSVKRYVKLWVERYDLAKLNVVEIGSLDINGSVRNLFSGGYVGVDACHGAGVDIVGDAVDVLWRLESTPEVIVSCEMLEHDLTPWRTLAAVSGALQSGGWLVLTCRGFDERGCWPKHNCPDDYYRFSVSAIRDLLPRFGLEVVELVRDPEGPGVLCLGKTGTP